MSNYGRSIDIYNLLQITNVQDHGAEGNGNVDCTLAFQSAIQYLVDVKAVQGIVWVPSGTYLLRAQRSTMSSCLTIPSNITIQGIGPASHLRLANSEFKTIFQNSDFSGGNSNIALKNLRINGNRLNNTSGSADGVIFNNVTDLLIEDVVIDNCRGDGLWLDGCPWLRCTRVYAHDNGRNGIGTSNCWFAQFTDCRTISNARTTAGTGSGLSLGLLTLDATIVNLISYDESGQGGNPEDQQLTGKRQAYGVAEGPNEMVDRTNLLGGYLKENLTGHYLRDWGRSVSFIMDDTNLGGNNAGNA